MDESKSKKQNPNESQRRFNPELLKKGLRCDLDQYEMLKRCSDKKDMTEWNEWRFEHPEEEILLEGANLMACNLAGAYLHDAVLQKAALVGACLKDARLDQANLQEAQLIKADLQNAVLKNAHLKGADLRIAFLQGADVYEAHLEGTTLDDTNLKAATFYGVHLEGAAFQRTLVDGSTAFWECKVDLDTDFRGVGLDSARIDPATKQLLEYNIRRMNWEDWYKEHPRLKWLVEPFWLMSDYGLSTKRIVATFFGLAFIFANIYYHWGRLAPPGIVSNLFIDENGVAVPWWLVPLRTLYFSIVTMTTLGFGDMYANAQSIWGHILLSLQVILGYVLLGALVTRFAVLFMAGGPAGRFADDKKKKE